MKANRLALSYGFRIRNYRIERVLGKGGFGITYLALDLEKKQRFAIKELLPDGIATRDDDGRVVPQIEGQETEFAWALEGFRHEAEVLSGLNHPNIVKVHELIETNGTAYMVMDYLHGIDLGEALESRPIPPDLRWFFKVFSGILDGLAAIHAQDQMHRDVKPDNVRLIEDDLPVLLDFGSAKANLGRTITMTTVVSHGYSPFEQYQTRARQGPFTDIYAAAALFYRAVVGEKPPVATNRITDESIRILAESTKLKEAGYPLKVLRAIDRALSWFPDQRPESIEQWREEMGAGTGPEPKPKPASKPATPVVKIVRPNEKKKVVSKSLEIPSASLAPTPPKKRWLRNLLAGAAAALAIAGLGFGWKQLNQRSPGEQLLFEARTAFAAGDFQAALDRIQSAKKAEPNLEGADQLRENAERELRIQELIARAESERQRKEFADLAKTAQSILELDPAHARAQQLLKIASEQMDLARFLAEAKSAISAEDFEKAIQAAEAALAIDSSHPEAGAILEEANRELQIRPILARANAALDAGDFEEARRLAEEALKVDPANAEAREIADGASREYQIKRLLATARSELEKEEFLEAISTAEQVVKLDPGNLDAAEIKKHGFAGEVAQQKLNQAMEALESGEFDIALARIREANQQRKLKGSDPLIDRVLGRRASTEGVELLKKFQFGPAEELAQKSLKLRPGNRESDALSLSARGLSAIFLMEAGEGDRRRAAERIKTVDLLAGLTNEPAFREFQLKALHWSGKYRIIGIGITHDLAEGLKRIEEAAVAGHPESMTQLGRWLVAGMFLPVDPDRGIELLRSAAAKNDPVAMLALAWFHRLGQAVDFNLEKAEDLERRAFEESRKRMNSTGDWAAMTMVARAQILGLGTNRSLAAAERVADRLIEEKSVGAFHLRWMIAAEKGDFPTALKVAEAWEQAGSASAPAFAGIVHESGEIGRRPDFGAAHACFLRAEQYGNGRGAANRAKYFFSAENPIFEERNRLVGGANPERAVKLLEFALNRDFETAAAGLGVLFQDGHHPEGKDIGKARQNFHKGMMLGDWESGILASYRFRKSAAAESHRIGPEQPDFELAERYLEACAAHGSPDALTELGFLHLTEAPTSSETLKKAFGYFQKAENRSHLEGTLLLATFYDPQYPDRNAAIGGANTARATELYKQLAARGSSDATFALGLMPLQRKFPKREDFEFARRHLEQAVDAGNSLAMTTLGEFHMPPNLLPIRKRNTRYANDVVGGKNLHEAHRLFKKAAAFEEGRALFYLGMIAEKGLVNQRADRSSAIGFYRRSQAQGDPDAAAALRRLGVK